MKLDADKIIHQIDQKVFPNQTWTATKTTLQRRFASTFKPLIQLINEQIKQHQLGQANLKVGSQMVISLEINVINMPYSSIRPLKRLITNDGSMTAQVYIMMSEPDLNRSHFRIDRVDSAVAFAKSPSAETSKIKKWILQQERKIKDYRASLAKKQSQSRKETKTVRKTHRKSRRSTRTKK